MPTGFAIRIMLRNTLTSAGGVAALRTAPPGVTSRLQQKAAAILKVAGRPGDRGQLARVTEALISRPPAWRSLRIAYET